MDGTVQHSQGACLSTQGSNTCVGQGTGKGGEGKEREKKGEGGEGGGDSFTVFIGTEHYVSLTLGGGWS